MFCKKCGQRVKDTENVCGKCGAVNQSAYYPKFTEDLCYCPECGRQAAREDKFCTKCGARLNFSAVKTESFAFISDKKEMKASPLSRWSYMPHFDAPAPAEENAPAPEQPIAEENKPTEAEEPAPIAQEPAPMEEAPAEEPEADVPAPMREEVETNNEAVNDYGRTSSYAASTEQGYRQEAVPEREVPAGEGALHRAPTRSYAEPKRSIQSADGVAAPEVLNDKAADEVAAPAAEKEPTPVAQPTPSAAEDKTVKQEPEPNPAPNPAPQPTAQSTDGQLSKSEGARSDSFTAPRPEQKTPAQSVLNKPYYNEIALDKRKDLENYSEPEIKKPAHMPLETDVIATKPREYKDKKGFGIIAIIFAILLPPIGIILGIVAISRGWTTMNKSYTRLGTAAIMVGVIMTVAFSFIAWKIIIPAVEDFLKTIS